LGILEALFVFFGFLPEFFLVGFALLVFLASLVEELLPGLGGFAVWTVGFASGAELFDTFAEAFVLLRVGEFGDGGFGRCSVCCDFGGGC
jgi:hypothetical protein